MMEKIKKTPLNRNVASPRSFVNFKTRCIQMSLTILCLLALVVLQSCSNTPKSKCSVTVDFGRENTIETADIVALPKNDDTSTVVGDFSEGHYWTVVQVPKATNQTTIVFNYDPRYIPPMGPPTPYALAYSKAACPLLVADQSFTATIQGRDVNFSETNYDYSESMKTFSFTSPGDYTIISAPAMQPTEATVTRTN